MQQGYDQYSGQHGQPQQQQQAVGGLSQQMGGMSLDGAQPHQPRKKKDRHAYHQLEQPAAPSGGQYLNGQMGGQPQPGVGPGQPAPGTAPWQQQAGQSLQPQGAAPAAAQFQAAAGTPISMSAGVGQQPGQMGGQGKVNPDQIPSVPLSRDLPAEYYQSHGYPTMEQKLPPPATTPLVAFDQGNASPKHARLTLNCIPSSYEQLTATALPLEIGRAHV